MMNLMVWLGYVWLCAAPGMSAAAASEAKAIRAIRRNRDVIGFPPF